MDEQEREQVIAVLTRIEENVARAQQALEVCRIRAMGKVERSRRGESLLRRALLQPDSDPALIREIRRFLEGS